MVFPIIFFRAVGLIFILTKLPKVLGWFRFDLRLEGKRYLFYLGMIAIHLGE